MATQAVTCYEEEISLLSLLEIKPQLLACLAHTQVTRLCALSGLLL
jgi:hypothetical protein